MKKLILLGGLLVASTQILSAKLPDCNPKDLQNEEVKNFTGVAAGGPLTVIITLGNTESVRFEGDQDAIATLITEVKGKTLIIRPQTSWTSWKRKYNNKKITVYINAIHLSSLTMSGSGEITVKGKISGELLATVLSGSGKITAQANVYNYTAVISGSGRLNINGKADKASIVITGSGSFTQKSFETNTLTSTISGSGNINITANNHIKATIIGSGSINYLGKAEVSQSIIGSGRVQKE